MYQLFKNLLYISLIFFFNLIFSQQATIFRFNADYNNGSTLQNEYETNVDISFRVDDIEETARGLRGTHRVNINSVSLDRCSRFFPRISGNKFRQASTTE